MLDGCKVCTSKYEPNWPRVDDLSKKNFSIVVKRIASEARRKESILEECFAVPAPSKRANNKPAATSSSGKRSKLQHTNQSC